MNQRVLIVGSFAIALVALFAWRHVANQRTLKAPAGVTNGTSATGSSSTVSETVEGPSIEDVISMPSKWDSPKRPVDSLSRLRAIRQCERSAGDDCVGLSLRKLAEVSETPAGLMNALADQTAMELARLKLQVENEMGRDQRPSFSVVGLASAYVKHPDDDVRESALDLTELVVFSEPRSALKIASQAVMSTVSGALAEKALMILQATRTSDPEAVDRTLLTALDRGGWEVRDRVAQGLLPFINSENRDAYARELLKAPARSKQALYLRLNLEEFDRRGRL